MKRIIQFVAVMVIAVLALSPAAEGLACLTHMAGRASACPMGMGELGPDCQMARDVATGCDTDCCNHPAPPIAAAWAATTKPKGVAAVALTALVVNAPAVAAVPAVKAMEPAMEASPPRYVLNRVFRI